MKVVDYHDVALEPVNAEGAEGAKIRWLIAQGDGAPNFALRMFEVEPGGHTPHHTHAWEHELYVLAGTGKLVTERGEFAFKADDVMYVDPNMKHSFHNTGEDTLKFLCIIPHEKPVVKKTLNPFAAGTANNCLEDRMEEKHLRFFKDLVSAPSPSGFEAPAQKVARSFMAPYADEIRSDVNGNLIAVKNGSGKLKVMVVGHADEIGFIINHIDEQGYVYVKTLGGFDVNLLPGLRVDIYHDGNLVRGIIGRKPIHMMRGEEGSPKLKLEDLWIDIGASSREDALKRVAIGDIATYNSHFEMLSEDLVVTKATDNKVGVYVAARVMQELAKKKLKANYYAVCSVGEETTMKGAGTSAFQIEPDIAIAVDVTFTSDIPGADKRVFGDVALGKGPTLSIGAALHPVIKDRLIQAAEKLKLPYQIEIAPGRTGTDADAIHALRAGAATAVIGIPNRYMHSPNEVISLSDLDNAVKMTAAFIAALDDKIVLTR